MCYPLKIKTIIIIIILYLLVWQAFCEFQPWITRIFFERENEKLSKF